MSEGEVQTLWDERAITRVLLTYCRGVDRMDEELLRSVAHPDAVTHHPPLYDGTWSGFVEALAGIASRSERWIHALSNIRIELDEDQANVESYYSSVTRTQSRRGARDFLLCGRYLDRFGRRGGRWAIRERTVVSDLWRVDAVTDDRWPASPMTPLLGTRTGLDPSYQQGRG